MLNARHCNLSPQGDGNHPTEGLTLAQKIAIYPRKGTETFISSDSLNTLGIAIYPRKGTETPLIIPITGTR